MSGVAWALPTSIGYLVIEYRGVEVEKKKTGSRRKSWETSAQMNGFESGSLKLLEISKNQRPIRNFLAN